MCRRWTKVGGDVKTGPVKLPLPALAALLMAGCIRPAPPNMAPAEIPTVRTADGWLLPLRRYPADGPPVLLVHGMGANHYNWDYRPEVSLAHALQQAGFDVWVPELRGDPGAIPPAPDAAKDFAFSDHARQDLPVIVDAVLATTGADRLSWVGHSMGGMLLYTALGAYPEKIQSGVAICSPIQFSRGLPSHRTFEGMGWAMEGRGKVPARALAGMTRPLGRSNPMYARVANKDNLDWAVTKGLAAHALVDLPKPLLREGIHWLQTGRLEDLAGQPYVAPADVPMLVMGAPADRIVAEPDVAAACQVYADCTYVELSTDHGFSVDYGHVDPVLGRSAATEVYPRIVSFLAQHRAQPSDADG